ncbi:dynamin family protein [Mariniluteicoccus endophyticus]
MNDLDHALASLAQHLAAHLDPARAPRARAVATALAEPPRVAVVGRVSSGKSTLVNALIGREIAPTAAGESTRVVTHYRYGAPDRAELVLDDGTVRFVPFVDRRVPDDLGVDPARVRRLEVHLQAGALRDLVLIDTPGLASLDNDGTATRASVLGSVEAGGAADALLFLFRDTEQGDDLAFLSEFREAGGSFDVRGLNSIGVLARADEAGGDDPLAASAARARALSAARRREVAAVVPVAALLASAVRAGRVDDAFTRDVASLASADAVRLRLADRLGAPEGVDADAFTRVQATLGAYATLAGRHRASDAVELMSWLEETSGVRELERVLRAEVLPPLRLIRAGRALDDLAALVAGMPLAGDVERLRLDPVTQPLRELQALQGLRVDDPSSELVPVLEALVRHDSPAQRLGLPAEASAGRVRETARRLAQHAKSLATLSFSPPEASAALVVVRSAQLLSA